MHVNKAISIAFISVVVALAVSASFSIVLRYGRPVGWDYRYHVEIAQEYAKGNFGATNPGIVRDFGTYPPLFHLFLALLINLGILLPASLFMQIAFYPLIIISVTYLAWKRLGLQHAAFAATILFGSVAVLDRAQVIPQSLDMIFIPLGFYFFLKKRALPALACLIITAYSHGLFALPFVAAMMIYAWRRNSREYRRIAVYAFLIFIPVLILAALTLPSYLSFAGGLNNPQEEIIARQPWRLPIYMGMVPMAMLPLSVIYLLKKKELLKGINGINEIMTYWLVFLLPLLVVMVDRFASYAVQPISILAAVAIITWLKCNTKRIWLPLAFMILLFLASFYTAYLPMLRLFWGWGGVGLDV